MVAGKSLDGAKEGCCHSITRKRSRTQISISDLLQFIPRTVESSRAIFSGCCKFEKTLRNLIINYQISHKYQANQIQVIVTAIPTLTMTVGKDISKDVSNESMGGEVTTSFLGHQKKVSFADIVRGNSNLVRGKVVSTK